MALSLANTITQVRYVLNEPTADFWSDAEITAWIQEATIVISSKTLLVEDLQTIDPLIANQIYYSTADSTGYTWIADALEIYSAIWNDGSNNYKGLIKINPKQIGNVATFTSGAPKYYSLFNRKIFVWPLATSAIAAGTGQIEVLYAKETNDVTDLTDELQTLAIQYAIAKAKQKDQKFAEANSLFQQFYNEVNFERADKHTREIDSIESFKVPRRGGKNA